MRNEMLASKRCWTALLCAIFSVWQLSAQTLDATRNLARAAMAQGDYAQAEALWLRVAFFEGMPRAWETQVALAEIDLQASRFPAAADAFEAAAALAPQDSLRVDCHLRAAAAGLQAQRFADVRQRLERLGPVVGAETEQRRQFFLGSAAYGQGDFVMAEAYWAGCIDSEFERMQLHDLFERHAKAGPKHAGMATVLSLVLPGAGQLYLGHPAQALKGVVLLGAIAAGGIYVGTVVGLVDALVLLLPTFSRYYVGGAMLARRDAKAKLQDERAEILREILELVGE